MIVCPTGYREICLTSLTGCNSKAQEELDGAKRCVNDMNVKRRDAIIRRNTYLLSGSRPVTTELRNIPRFNSKDDTFNSINEN